MPSVPKQTTCIQLGCNNLRSKRNGYCLEHGGKDKSDYKFNSTQERKEFNAMYNTSHWQTLRQRQLSTHPICAGCKSEGVITPATTVDHIFPWRHYGREAFYINFFQSLCATHHAHKTQLEQHGIYRRYGEPVVDHLKQDYMRLLRGAWQRGIVPRET